jgi:effector-binding domain-containing protein
MIIPSGVYASMKAKGNPENLFYHWESFKKYLLKDKYLIKSPVYEIYKTAFNTVIPLNEQTGELRYQLNPVK